MERYEQYRCYIESSGESRDFWASSLKEAWIDSGEPKICILKVLREGKWRDVCLLFLKGSKNESKKSLGV